MNNKKNGTAFEEAFAELLSKNGFWAHLMQDNRNGQPFDVIAAKDGKTFVFDCKDCTLSHFTLSRIEENQHNAMKLWEETGNGTGYFVIKFPDKIYIVSYPALVNTMKIGKKRLLLHDMDEIATDIQAWIDQAGGKNANHNQ